MTIKENLIRAKALISDEAHWLKGQYSAVRNGVDCYCTLGAVSEALGVMPGNGDKSPEANALRAALPAGFVDIPNFNDFHATFADIHALFDRAIGAQP